MKHLCDYCDYCTVALRFPSSTDILGLTLELKVMYPSPAEEKEMVLSVEGLPLHKFPAEKLRDALVNYISKHTSHKAAECRIIDGVGYLSFDDPAGMSIDSYTIQCMSVFPYLDA